MYDIKRLQGRFFCALVAATEATGMQLMPEMIYIAGY